MMDNVTRYALILEAYLRGCSESVLVRVSMLKCDTVV